MPATNLWFSLLVIIISRAHPNMLWQNKNHLKYSTHSRYWFCYFLLWFQDGFGYKWYIHCLTASNMNCLSYFICSLRSHGTQRTSHFFFLFFSLSLFLSENIWIEQHVWVQYEIYRDDGFCRKNSHNKIKTIAQQ